MEKKNITYHIDTARGNFYISYDREHHVARCEGHEAQMPEGALITFIHTAKELGFNAGAL